MDQFFRERLVDFFAEITDVYINGICAALVIKVPKVVLDIFTRKEDVLISQKIFKKGIFFCR